jgi:Right handed beta helix region
MRPTHSVVLISLLACLGAALVTAGPLDPPVGPVAPTLKTLAEIEPRIAINQANTPGDADSLFKITQPGSYYLTGNILGAPARNGIEIAIPLNQGAVSIDLGGFELAGTTPVGQPVSLNGVFTQFSSEVTVRNGTIRGWGGSGVQFGGAAKNCSMDHVRSVGNGGNGFTLPPQSTVRDCDALRNASLGITLNGGLVARCTVVENTGHGISGAVGTHVIDCTARANGEAGISVAQGGFVGNCMSSHNGTDGILSAGGRVVGNSCTFNSGAGIHVGGDPADVQDNTVISNARGIKVDAPGSMIARNTARGNTANFDIVGSQNLGPIIPGIGLITTTSPWANFSF